MPTMKQKRAAAKLWSLAIVAHCDLAADHDISNEIRAIAITEAQSKLGRLGYHWGDLIDEQSCLIALCA